MSNKIPTSAFLLSHRVYSAEIAELHHKGYNPLSPVLTNSTDIGFIMTDGNSEVQFVLNNIHTLQGEIWWWSFKPVKPMIGIDKVIIFND